MPGKRRGSGEGAIYRRKDGRWVASVDLGSIGGKRRRKVIYGKTRRHVAEQLKGLHRQQQEGMLRGANKTTVGGYLLEWLETAHMQRRESTVEHYRHIVTAHIIPHVGHIRLDRLTADDVNALAATITAKGHAPTARQARQILNRAFKDAIRRRRLLINPVAGTDPPTHTAKPPQTLNDDEAHALLIASDGERFGIALALGLLLGLRRGEISGLQWDDVDWQARTVRIERTAKRVGGRKVTPPPKTKSSIRTLPLIAGLEDALRSHQAAQAEEFALKGIVNQDNRIVASQTGTTYDTANYLRAFRQIVRKAGLPQTLRPHDLRHSTASLLIGHGVDPRTAASIMGHASTATTMDIYTRGQQTDRRGALEALEKQLRKDK